MEECIIQEVGYGKADQGELRQLLASQRSASPTTAGIPSNAFEQRLRTAEAALQSAQTTCRSNQTTYELSLNSLKSQHRVDIERLQTEHEQAISNLKAAIAEPDDVVAVEAKYKALLAKRNQKFNELEEEKAKLVAEQNAAVAEMQAKLDKAQAATRSVRGASRDAAIRQLEEEKMSLEDDLAVAQSKIEMYRQVDRPAAAGVVSGTSTPGLVASLIADLEETKAKLKAAEGKVSTTQLVSLTSNLAEAQAERNALKKRFDLASADLRTTQQALVALDERSKSADARHTESAKQAAASLTQITAERDDALKQAERSTGGFSTVSARFDALRERTQMLCGEARGIRTELGPPDLSRTADVDPALNTSIKTATEALRSRVTHIANLQAQAKTQADWIASLEAKVSSTSAELEQVQQQLAARDTALQEKAQDLEASQKEVEHNVALLAAAIRSDKKREEEVAGLAEEVAKLKEKAKKSDEEHAKAEERSKAVAARPDQPLSPTPAGATASSSITPAASSLPDGQSQSARVTSTTMPPPPPPPPLPAASSPSSAPKNVAVVKKNRIISESPRSTPEASGSTRTVGSASRTRKYLTTFRYPR